MRDDKKQNIHTGRRVPSFSVQDEIRRDRRMRQTTSIRRARSATRRVLTAALCLLIGVLLAGAVVLAVTRAKVVTVSVNSRYSAEEILQAANMDGEGLLFLSEKTVYDRVVVKCPYVERIQLVKVYPSSVEIVVYETEPMYVTVARGRQFSLDRELRVMDYTNDTDGLIFLALPELKSAVEGSRVVFVDASNESFVFEMLKSFFGEEKTIACSFLDLTDRYDVTAIVGDSIKVQFGDYRNLDVKIDLANKIIADAEAARSARTLINVSEPSRSSVQYDYKGEF